MKQFFVIVLFLLLIPSITAAQSSLSPDQELLLADIRAAFESRDTWDSYSLNLQESSSYAITILGSETQQWATSTRLLEADADYDVSESASRGVVRLEHLTSSADASLEPLRDSLMFVAIDGELLAGAEGDGLAAAEDDTAAMFELARLSDSQALIPPTELLDHATAVYDLGVENRIQSYQVELNFAASLPLIPFDLESFVQQFPVDPDLMTEAITQNTSLEMLVRVDLESGHLMETRLILNIAADLEGGDFVSLTYGQESRVHYHNINAAFDIWDAASR